MRVLFTTGLSIIYSQRAFISACIYSLSTRTSFEVRFDMGKASLFSTFTNRRKFTNPHNILYQKTQVPWRDHIYN